MNIDQRLESIKEKLALLKSKDKEMKTFGAGDDKFYGTIGHHYELNPVLSEEQIVAVEKKLGIAIPVEYREFLKKVGDGGAGPEWGLFKLENTYPSDELLQQYPEFCSMDCDYADDYANGIKGKLDKDPYYFEEVEGFGGYIKLSDYGHGLTAYMVVDRTQQTGMMWLMEENNGIRIKPMTQKISGRGWQVGFLDWYENWLDDSLAKL